MQARHEDRSLGELFSELTREVSALVRQEMNLAKTEMTQKATRAGRNVGFIAAGGAVAYAGLLAIIAAIIILLGMAIPLWVSALIIGVLVAIIGYFLVEKGINTLKHESLAPQETIETLKEDATWMRGQAT